jgi:hypothetical protein
MGRDKRRLMGLSASVLMALALSMSAAGCGQKIRYGEEQAASGPGELVGRSDALNLGFSGGPSPDFEPRDGGAGNPFDCDADCRAYCEGLPFENPIDRAICPALWGAGLDTRPVVPEEACRRLFIDTRGRFPSYWEIAEACLGRGLGETVTELLLSEDFVFEGQRRWADLLGYNNVAVSVERIYDADKLVGKLYSGLVRFDEFVEVVSAHPVFTRRLNDAADRAEALFTLFVGRPPFANERADMANLYSIWNNGYHDDPMLGERLPDAFVEHRCVGPDGSIDEDTAGTCTSVLWGFHRVILKPDFRAKDNLTWSGNLTPKEWAILQTPGKIIGAWPEVWEHMVSEVVRQYLGYDLAKYSPEVIKELVEYVLEHGGDIRAAHYAVLTSSLYLQSTDCGEGGCEEDAPPWTFGPLKQTEAEQWVDSVSRLLGYEPGACDHRIPEPDELLESIGGYELVNDSRWTFRQGRNGQVVDRRYSDLVRTLGGCPDNLTSGRFKAVSILNTASQEAFVAELCNPLSNDGKGVPVEVLLPHGMSERTKLDEGVANEVLDYQVGQFLGRLPTDAEREMANESSNLCVPKPCTAGTFARGLCFSLLSSSEMLFY